MVEIEELDFVRPEDAKEATLKEAERRWRNVEAANPISHHPVKADIIISIENVCTATDLVEVCKFGSDWWAGKGIGIKEYAKMFRLLTEFEMTEGEFAKACERVYHVERAFSVREGSNKKGRSPLKKVWRRAYS